MLDSLPPATSHRALRLFGATVCRRIWTSLTDDRLRNAVEVAEQFARGSADEAALHAAHEAASTAILSISDTLTPEADKAKILEDAQCSPWDAAIGGPLAAVGCSRPVERYWALNVAWDAAMAGAWAKMSGDIASYYAALEAEYAAQADICRSLFDPVADSAVAEPGAAADRGLTSE